MERVNKEMKLVVQQMASLQIDMKIPTTAPYLQLSNQFFFSISKLNELEKELLSLLSQNEGARASGIPSYYDELVSVTNQRVVEASTLSEEQTPDSSIDQDSECEDDSYKVEEIKR